MSDDTEVISCGSADDGLTPIERKIAKKRATAARKALAHRDVMRAKRRAAAEAEDAERAEGSGGPPAVRAGQMRMVPDGAVLSEFMQDWTFVTGIMGPWGSGKTTACIGKLFMAASMQRPDGHGRRRTRWLIVRDSYPNLQETTVKSWLEWFPEDVYGPLRRSRPFMHMIKVPGAPYRGKPTRVEMEVIFIALEEEDDRKKLLSYDLTGAWINEAREFKKGIIDDITGRVAQKRFPPMRDGGPTWAGVFMDTNAPSETHWWPIMSGLVAPPDDMSEEIAASLKMPENWAFFQQPGALLEKRDGTGNPVFVPNPAAENIKYLQGGHKAYLDGIGGKTRSWIRVNFCNRLGEISGGKPVWPNFDREAQVAAVCMDAGLVLHVGVDSTGRNPAAVFGQVSRNHWRIIGELVARDVNMDTFAPMVRRKIADLSRAVGISYETVLVSLYRDPHMERSQIDDRTVDRIFMKHGLRLIPAPGGNGLKHRLDTVETIIDSKRVTIDPSCRMLIAACEGAYKYRKLHVSGGEQYTGEPDKRNCGSYADVADAFQYTLLGAGEGRAMMQGNAPPRPKIVATRYRPGEHRDDLWSRMRL